MANYSSLISMFVPLALAILLHQEKTHSKEQNLHQCRAFLHLSHPHHQIDVPTSMIQHPKPPQTTTTSFQPVFASRQRISSLLTPLWRSPGVHRDVKPSNLLFGQDEALRRPVAVAVNGRCSSCTSRCTGGQEMFQPSRCTSTGVDQ